MRLFQILALAAFSLAIFKLIGLAAQGVFEGVGVPEAAAQNAPVAENRQEQPQQNQQRQSNADQNAGSQDSRSAILNRLAERRDELEKRERDLKLREELLKAAEKRLKAQLSQAEKAEKEEESENSKNKAKALVVIYENMKPKDAARIFDQLSLSVLYNIAISMNPRKMSAVLAEMNVKAAERLTVEMAARSSKRGQSKANRTLSKIGG